MTEKPRISPLIERVDGPDPDDTALQSDSVEAAFLIPGETHLQLNATHWEHKAADYLARAVARNPSDLRAHVQRILLHMKQDNETCLYGALLDLFIALGAHGHHLKVRMLLTTGDRLEDKHRDFLLSRLHDVVFATETLEDTQCAVLPKGYSGSDTLIVVNHHEDGYNPLRQARLLLSHGQLYEAQQLLEPLVIDNPDSIDLHRQLIEIYEQTGDREAFDKTTQALKAAGSLLTGIWLRRAAQIGGKS